MNLKDTEEKLKEVDSLLTTLTKLLKKHWIVLLLILLAWTGYFIWNYDDTEDEETQTEQTQ